MIRFATVIEKSDTGFAAYVPDLPGCVAAPEPSARVLYVDVPRAA